MIKITCSETNFFSGHGEFATIDEAEAAYATLPKGVAKPVYEWKGSYAVTIKQINLRSNGVSGDKNEAGIARIKKVINSEFVTYSNEMLGNSMSEEGFLAFIG